MVNIGESLINVVTQNKPKMLIGLDQKGGWSGTGVFCSPVTVVAPSADRRDLPHAGIQVKRGKPISLLIIRKANREVIGLAM